MDNLIRLPIREASFHRGTPTPYLLDIEFINRAPKLSEKAWVQNDDHCPLSSMSIWYKMEVSSESKVFLLESQSQVERAIPALAEQVS
jgi:hypothetical protein